MYAIKGDMTINELMNEIYGLKKESNTIYDSAYNDAIDHCLSKLTTYMHDAVVSGLTNTEEKVEKVNHPQHYNRDGAMECIDEMVVMFGLDATINFCRCNAWKYRYRAGLKGNAEDDLKKSDWYVKKADELKKKAVPSLDY